jgi:phosphoribosylpyrophosphate synthetase
VHLAATHAVFQPHAQQLFVGEEKQSQPDSVVVTNSVALPEEFMGFVDLRLKVLDLAPMYATLIARLHSGESIADLCGL